ncbi:hypothetical protein OIU85_028783 [Salix viminalis]|uniref:Uncharacterized protein n=1 Tax=Salix viminalis TaxID=40686 RepID=A0A9Q0T6F0_SALVM|nr:hypothetical protein OIU85_028783 [Salix viminalis]
MRRQVLYFIYLEKQIQCLLIHRIFIMKIAGDDDGDWRCPLVAEYGEWMDGCHLFYCDVQLLKDLSHATHSKTLCSICPLTDGRGPFDATMEHFEQKTLTAS